MPTSRWLPVLLGPSGCALLIAVGASQAPSTASAPPPTRSVTEEVRYTAPVTPLSVVRGFDPPSVRYGSGHLGVDVSSRSGTVVVSAADGIVSFAGLVAGRGVVVVLHADGIRTEYEPVTPMVRTATRVSRGQPVGRLAGRHRGCGGPCLHWGARRGAVYLDPLDLLRRLGVVRLLPWDPRG